MFLVAAGEVLSVQGPCYCQDKVPSRTVPCRNMPSRAHSPFRFLGGRGESVQTLTRFSLNNALSLKMRGRLFHAKQDISHGGGMCSQRLAFLNNLCISKLLTDVCGRFGKAEISVLSMPMTWGPLLASQAFHQPHDFIKGKITELLWQMTGMSVPITL